MKIKVEFWIVELNENIYRLDGYYNYTKKGKLQVEKAINQLNRLYTVGTKIELRLMLKNGSYNSVYYYCN